MDVPKLQPLPISCPVGEYPLQRVPYSRLRSSVAAADCSVRTRINASEVTSLPPPPPVHLTPIGTSRGPFALQPRRLQLGSGLSPTSATYKSKKASERFSKDTDVSSPRTPCTPRTPSLTPVSRTRSIGQASGSAAGDSDLKVRVSDVVQPVFVKTVEAEEQASSARTQEAEGQAAAAATFLRREVQDVMKEVVVQTLESTLPVPTSPKHCGAGATVAEECGEEDDHQQATFSRARVESAFQQASARLQEEEEKEEVSEDPRADDAATSGQTDDADQPSASAPTASEACAEAPAAEVDWRAAPGHLAPEAGEPRLRAIFVRAGKLVDEVHFDYSDGTSEAVRFSFGGVWQTPFKLTPGEYLMEVEANQGWFLSSVVFITSSGRRSMRYGEGSRLGGLLQQRAEPGFQIWGLSCGVAMRMGKIMQRPLPELRPPAAEPLRSESIGKDEEETTVTPPSGDGDDVKEEKHFEDEDDEDEDCDLNEVRGVGERQLTLASTSASTPPESETEDGSKNEKPKARAASAPTSDHSFTVTKEASLPLLEPIMSPRVTPFPAAPEPALSPPNMSTRAAQDADLARSRESFEEFKRKLSQRREVLEAKLRTGWPTLRTSSPLSRQTQPDELHGGRPRRHTHAGNRRAQVEPAERCEAISGPVRIGSSVIFSPSKANAPAAAPATALVGEGVMEERPMSPTYPVLAATCEEEAEPLVQEDADVTSPRTPRTPSLPPQSRNCNIDRQADEYAANDFSRVPASFCVGTDVKEAPDSPESPTRRASGRLRRMLRKAGVQCKLVAGEADRMRARISSEEERAQRLSQALAEKEAEVQAQIKEAERLRALVSQNAARSFESLERTRCAERESFNLRARLVAMDKARSRKNSYNTGSSFHSGCNTQSFELDKGPCTGEKVFGPKEPEHFDIHFFGHGPALVSGM